MIALVFQVSLINIPSADNSRNLSAASKAKRELLKLKTKISTRNTIYLSICKDKRLKEDFN